MHLRIQVQIDYLSMIQGKELSTYFLNFKGCQVSTTENKKRFLKVCKR